MKVLKRNQIIIFVFALTLISVGYLSYMENNKENIATSQITSELEYARNRRCKTCK